MRPVCSGNPERFLLRIAIEETCAASDPRAQKKGFHIDVDIAHEIGDVMLDRNKFKQVVALHLIVRMKKWLLERLSQD